MTDGDDVDARARRARREWITANHPDRGGDPQSFVAGLARLDALRDHAWTDSGRPYPGRAGVHLSRSPIRRLRRFVRRVRRRAAGLPPSRVH